MQMLSPDGVHLLPDYPVYLVPDPLSEEQHGIVAGGQLPYESSPEKEAMAGRLGMGGIVPQGRYEQLGPAHPRKDTVSGLASVLPSSRTVCESRPTGAITLWRG